MKNYLIKNANIVNEGQVIQGDIRLKNGRIEQIGNSISANSNEEVIDASGCYALPGIIDDQVHFREPGLTHKAEIFTESAAAVAGGVTSFMEMPNTVPNTLTQELLQNKYDIAANRSLANYSFFMGVSNNNLEEVLKTDRKSVCGIKVFMGSSTGNMLVDNERTLTNLFSKAELIIATHCEDEATIKANTALYHEKYGDNMPFKYHPEIRSAEACYKSSSFAVELAKKHNTRLHILHISTAKETSLFDNSMPLKDKHITAEACIHHLWFTANDYDKKGAFIKWNPAVKYEEDRAGVWEALMDDRIDVIATDHAPHTFEEKSNNYFSAPSGGPLIQHTLVAMMEFYHHGKISMEKIVQKMCHNPAIMFDIQERGFIREGYHADLVVVDPNSEWKVSRDNILAKCGWSPFENSSFKSSVKQTFVNGELVYNQGTLDNAVRGERLVFDR